MGTIILEALACVIGAGSFIFLFYTLLNVILDLQPSLYSNFKYSRHQMRQKVKSKKQWSEDERSTHDIELTFESFKRFVSLNSEGWTWKKEYGIYDCNPCFQLSRRDYYYIRFKTYRDYMKAAAYWQELNERKSKEKQQLVEAKNTAEFLAIQKQRAKDAEEQAARQMRESEEQIMEILERLKSEPMAVGHIESAPIAVGHIEQTPSGTVTVSDTGKRLTVTQGWMDMQPIQDSYYVLCGDGKVLKFLTRLEAEQEYMKHL